jgi:hypothetical protein
MNFLKLWKFLFHSKAKVTLSAAIIPPDKRAKLIASKISDIPVSVIFIKLLRSEYLGTSPINRIASKREPVIRIH